MDEMKEELSGVKKALGEIKKILINLTHNAPRWWQIQIRIRYIKNGRILESKSRVSLENPAALMKGVDTPSLAPNHDKDGWECARGCWYKEGTENVRWIKTWPPRP